MPTVKPIHSALISVFHKEGLEPLVRELAEREVTIYSTGGTQRFIEELGVDVIPVEALTSYPSILGGRVKTLHPKVFGGILARRSDDTDIEELQEFQIPEIDLIVVDLYPFEQTVAGGASEQDIIEKIDIGGISLLRAAAKNFHDTAVVSHTDQYGRLVDLLKENHGGTRLDDRRRLAVEAFDITSHYDAAIFGWMRTGAQLPEQYLKVSLREHRTLRYGENPHQDGFYFGHLDRLFIQLNGKELSYNNLLDIDSTLQLLGEFRDDSPTALVVKHNNACGLAVRSDLGTAWKDALAGDPVSAFGGVIGLNRPLNVETAKAINELFFEVLVAPEYEAEALELLKGKKNRIILQLKRYPDPKRTVRSALDGYLVQDADTQTDGPAQFKCVTNRRPSAQEEKDLVFANKIVKHTRSNAIVLAKNEQLVGSGTGQTSRVDALMQAIGKARSFKLELDGAVMASDAFFPFPDCVEIADKAGIKSVIQPGGSIKDQLSVDYCDNRDMAMVMTGTRHFKH